MRFPLAVVTTIAWGLSGLGWGQGPAPELRLTGSQIVEVEFAGVTVPVANLRNGSSNAGTTLQGSGSLADDFDLETYFAKNGSALEWDVDLGSVVAGAQGQADIVVCEAGGNDTVVVRAWLADGSFGAPVTLAPWTATSYSIAAGPNSNQRVHAAPIRLAELRDATGAALGAGVVLRGLRLESPNIDGASVFAIDWSGGTTPLPHLPPLADAGEDRLVWPTQGDVWLDATGSRVRGGASEALQVEWHRIAGPGSASIDDVEASRTRVRSLSPGAHLFEVIVVDASGLSARDQVRVEVLGGGRPGGVASGTLEQWHKVTLSFDGPLTSESAATNPFRDLRLDVFLSDGTRTLVVPGYFAADGDAGRTHASGGSVWRAHFAPDQVGTWTWYASFRQGMDVAADAEIGTGTAVAAFDGQTGSFVVAPSSATGRDFRGKGRLDYVGRHHLQHAGSGEWFLKGGADSPENFFAFRGFDGTPNDRHAYVPHAADWNAGDPDWTDDEGHSGRNLIGALNYLASEEMNSVYFLTMNVQGDGNDVWPWVSSSSRDRFDCSKLDQWGWAIDHMDRLGILAHVITQETENDQLLNGGALGVERRVYYRELIARFAAKNALVWNLGEENTNTDAQRREFANFIRAVDPQDHPIVVHTYPGQQGNVYSPLLGFPALEGPSVQEGNASGVHASTVRWVEGSAAAGRPWVVCLDEIGPANDGVLPDANDPTHDGPRTQALWGNLMGGGAGAEWYFGYRWAHDDLDCEDWRSRDIMWDQTRYALEFFRRLPFWRMQPSDALVGAGAWCLTDPEEAAVAVYMPNGGTTDLDLTGLAGDWTVAWFDPRNGGGLQTGSVPIVTAAGVVQLGGAPDSPGEDWAVLLQPVGVDYWVSHARGVNSALRLRPDSAPRAGQGGFGLVLTGGEAGATVVLAMDFEPQANPLTLGGEDLWILPWAYAVPWFQIDAADRFGTARFGIDLSAAPGMAGLTLHAQAVASGALGQLQASAAIAWSLKR